MRPLGSPAKLEERRIHAIALLKKKKSPVEVARQVGVEYRSVRRWYVAYQKNGEDALKARSASGRPPKLASKDKIKLEKVLLAGAKHAGYPTDLWTCPRITEVIYRTFKVRYHSAHVSKILHAMRWSPQKPERRAKERDEKAIAGWVRYKWPRIKKKPMN